MIYYRPVAMTDAARPATAHALAGGWCWFSQVERIERGRASVVIQAAEVPEAVLQRMTEPRAALAGLVLDSPRLMGILNTTPDSFSDGGRFDSPDAALAHARAMRDGGADILDIGGESTRPGAAEVSPDEEIRRTAPLIAALRAGPDQGVISIDTRKAAVAQAALNAGADLINDVSALTHDADLSAVVATGGVPVCLMHARGNPATMQDDPRYPDVLLDVYDFLAARIAAAEAIGIGRARILVDPGLGFGKTAAHNLALIRGVSLLHGLGCAIVLGASRKRFIGSIGGESRAEQRVPGSIAVALCGLAQGVQVTRVHDLKQTRQAFLLWQAVNPAGQNP